MLKVSPAARTDACGVSDARSSCTLAAAADNTRGSAVTATTSAEVVGSSIRRLFHHRMMSGSVCDGLKLDRRPYNGRGITISPIRAPRLYGRSQLEKLFTARFRAF